MDKRTSNAIEVAIRKWRYRAAGAHKEPGMWDCPLCALYNNGNGCCDKKCPVVKRTKYSGCCGTPCARYSDYLDDLEEYYDSDTMGAEITEDEDNHLRSIAGEEVAFLISLRQIHIKRDPRRKIRIVKRRHVELTCSSCTARNKSCIACMTYLDEPKVK